MKILFVHNKYLQSVGGEDMAVDAEIKLLKTRGHEVSVLYFSNDHFGGGVLSKIKSGIGAIYNNESKTRLKKTIREFKPDIIHVHNFYFDASPSVFDGAAACGVPIVFTIHNYRLVCVNSLLLRDGKVCEDCLQSFFPWKGVVHKCYHNSFRDSTMVGLISATHKLRNTWTTKVNRYITPSAFMRNKLLASSLNITDPSMIEVKGNFIEDPGAAIPQSRGNDFLFIGRLSKEKGINFLVNSFIQWPGHHLTVVGDGPEKETLEQHCLGVKNITFVGKQDKTNVLRLMKNSRALIFPSIWYEGLPVTIVEALATGTPVIASNLGAMTEMVTHGVSGLLFEKESMTALYDEITTINKMIAGEDFSLFQGAREAFIKNYHPDICYEKIMDIYQAVIKEHHEKLSA